MVPDDLHDFFVASAGVAGALIGLLFVALTVASGRLDEATDRAQIHRIRASAALTAFTNALALSLLALLPIRVIGPAAVALSIGGLTFVIAALLSLIRLRQVRWRTVPDAFFLVGLIVVLVTQLLNGIAVIRRPGDSGAVDTIALLVAICSLVGVSRAWELVGGPAIGLRHEITAMVRGGERTTHE